LCGVGGEEESRGVGAGGKVGLEVFENKGDEEERPGEPERLTE